MTSCVPLLRASLAATIWLIMATGQIMADSGPDGIAWNNASPSQIHQRLADGKAGGLAEKEMIRGLALSQPMDNNQPDYDVTLYDIAIRVNDTTEVIYGVVTMVAASTIDGLTEVEVNFQADMTMDSVKSSAGPRVYSRDGDLLTAVLTTSLDTGEQFAMTFYYHGHPTEGGFQGFTFDSHGGKPMISSLSEPYFARSWWPCKDRMDDKADSFKIAIEVDTLFYVASNGTLDSVVTAGANSHVYYYTEHYPMVTYLFSVAIHPFTVWTDEWIYNDGLDTMPIVHAVYPDKYSYSLGTYDVTPQALDVLPDNYGQYPFVEEKYGHANFNWGGSHGTPDNVVDGGRGHLWFLGTGHCA